MKLFSKAMKIGMVIVAAVVLGLLGEFNRAGPAWNEVLWGADDLPEQVMKPATTTLTRREFADAIGRAVRGF